MGMSGSPGVQSKESTKTASDLLNSLGQTDETSV